MKPKIWMFTLLILFAMTVIGVISAKIDGWDTSPNTQYHIQTDEGPERYFKYQTISGQYRKEKRLQDGTVIGSYGWVDADGYLRLNDYIADTNGYRIVKTKRQYVGSQQTPVAAPPPYVPAVPANDISSPEFKEAQPYVEDKSKYLVFPSSSPAPSPLAVFSRRRPTAPSAYYPTSTPPNILGDADIAITSTPHYYVQSSKSSYAAAKVAAAYKPPLYTTYVKNRPDYSLNSVNPYYGEKLQASRKSYDEPAVAAAAPNYDGISVTRNGFKYFLPRQYHEEEGVGDERVGSYGYIDPFGIRRVVYYNASPGSGFVHRKNNRYVGFNATPYDPRP